MKALKLTLLYVFFVFFMHGMGKDKKKLDNSKILTIMINYCRMLYSKDIHNAFRIMKSMNAGIEYQKFLHNKFKNTIFISEEIKNDEEKSSKSFFNDKIYNNLKTVISQLGEEEIITRSDSNENMNNKENPEKKPENKKSNNITFKDRKKRRSSFP